MSTAPPERERAYYTTLHTIAYQSGDPQPPLVAARPLWTTLVSHGSLTHDAAQTALRAAVENDHVIKWVDARDGTIRYGLTGDGIDAAPDLSPPELSRADLSELTECLEAEASTDDPDTAFVAWANARMQAIREAGQ